MSFICSIIHAKLANLIVQQAVPPLNNAPVWDSQPSVSFTYGVASTYDFNDIASDPDLDAITFSLNTGAVSLPSGVTWDSGTGILSYDGVGAVASSAGHIATVSDGTDSTVSSSFSIAISDQFPARWPQPRGAYLISNYTNVLSTAQASWSYNNDVLIYQGVWPSGATVETIDGYISAQRTNYPNCKMVPYTIPPWSYDESDTFLGHRQVQRRAIINAGAESQWYLRHPTSGNYLYGSGDQVSAVMTNVSDVCPLVGGETFITAYTAEWFTRFSSGNNGSDVVALSDGIYFDGLDIENAFPQPVDGYLGADYDGVPDYDVDGSADGSQARYRLGCIDLAEEFEDVAINQYGKPNWYVATNGGRDYAINVGTLSEYEWFGRLGHMRVMENAHGSAKFNIQYDGAGGFVTGSGMANRFFGTFIRSALVSHAFCIPQSTSGIRPYCLIDYQILIGGVGATAGDMNEDAWILQEAIWAACMLTEELMYGVQINKQQPAPDIDLYNVDTGDPLATRSLGTLSADGQTFTPRTPDSTEDGGQWYIEEFENGYVWFNAADPDNSSAWPQPGNASTLSADLPTPPSGKKGIFIDSATYVNTTFGLSAQGYASSRYDGSDATSITAGPLEGGWVHWVDI